MSGQKRGLITLKKMIQSGNITGEDTAVLKYKIPRSEVYLLMANKPFNLFLPTSDTFNHGGTGDESFNLNDDIIDSGSLTDDLTAVACRVADESDILTVVSIDYENDSVTVNHDTNEDIKIYYLPKGGEVSVKVTAPFASGALSKTLYNSSLLKIHSMDQYNERSLLTFDKAFIVPPTYFIEVTYKGDVSIDWHPNNNIGDCVIPYRVAPESEFPSNLSDRIKSQMIGN